MKSLSLFRAFSSAVSPAAVEAGVRNTLKSELSRKTYLVDTYTHTLRNNAIILAVHNSTLLKADDKKFRQEVKKAGGNFMVVRSGLLNVALRGLEHEDPASKKAHELYKKNKHPLSALFNGPSALIAIPELDPSIVKSIVKAIEATNNKLILLGGQVDGSVLHRADVEKFKEMPTLPQLQAELAGVLTVLGGAGLVQTLESSSKMLYLTLDERRKDMKEE